MLMAWACFRFGLLLPPKKFPLPSLWGYVFTTAEQLLYVLKI
jgi:hypothetical protein